MHKSASRRKSCARRPTPHLQAAQVPVTNSGWAALCLLCTTTEAIAEMNRDDASFDIELLFRAHYGRVMRIIGRVISDRARAEELAVEVFLRLWRNPKAQGEKVEGWLYRVAVRASLEELRRRSRRARYESLFGVWRTNSALATPEEIRRECWRNER